MDEDLAGRELLSRPEVAFPGEVLGPAREASDDQVWRRAQAEAAAILTSNAVDFLRLAREHESHHGLMWVDRINKPTDLKLVINDFARTSK